MKSLFVVFVLASTVAATAASAQLAAVSLQPADIKFTPIPTAPGASVVWLAGAVDKAGPYTLRVSLKADAKIPPHTHPDSRMITVLSGQLFAGAGATFDPNSGKLYPAGSFFVIPANTPHFAWAKTGAVVYQESGVGPSPTVPIKK